MKTKLKTIVNAREAVGRLAGQALPVSVSYRVAKLVKAMNEELRVYEAERVKVCEKCGTLNEAEGKYIINKGEEFNRELSSLLDMQVELNVEKVTLPETLNITPHDIIALEEFVQIEGAEDG